MKLARPLLSLFALVAVFALGACEKQSVSTIESFEKTLHHHGDHGDGEHKTHGEDSAESPDAKKSEKAPVQPH